MNPLLASSIDYEEYLKGRLQSAASGGSSTRQIVNRSDSIERARGDGNEEYVVPLQHSWRGHVRASASERQQTHVKSGGGSSGGKLTLSVDNECDDDAAALSPKSLRYSRNNSSSDKLFELSTDDSSSHHSLSFSQPSWASILNEAEQEQQEHYLEQTLSPVPTTPKVLLSPAKRSIRVEDNINIVSALRMSGVRTSSSFEDGEADSRKGGVHSIVKGRFFRKWLSQSQRRGRREQAVRDQLRTAKLTTVFATMKNHYLLGLGKLNTKAQTNLLARTFKKWHATNRSDVDSKDSMASKHYYLYKTFRTIRMLKYHMLKKRAINEMLRNKSLAKKHYDYCVLRKVVTNWRFTVRKMSSQKEINSEHNHRLEMIKSLVHTIGNKTVEGARGARAKAAGASRGLRITADDLRQQRYEERRGKERADESRGGEEVAARMMDDLSGDSSGEEAPLSPPPPPYQPFSGPRQELQREAAEKTAKGSGGPMHERPLNKQRLPPRHHRSTSRESGGGGSAAAKSAAAVSISKTADAARESSPCVTQDTLDERNRLRREKGALLRRQAEERVAKRNEFEAEVQRAKLRKEEDDILQKVKDERTLKSDRQRQEDARARERVGWLQRAVERSDRFYRKQLLIRRGFSPWMRLMELNRMNRIRAKAFYNDNLLQNAFVSMYAYSQAEIRDRNKKESRQSQTALLFRRKRLLRIAWRGFLLNRRMLKAKAKAVTGHFSRFTTRRRAFRAWRLALERTRRAMVSKTRAVVPRGDLCTRRFYYRRWQAFLQESLIEREVNKRTQAMMSKVKSWL